MKKKIAIIAPGLLPVPAVKSGGIEQLIENIINENEKKGLVHITVLSSYSKETVKLKLKYKNVFFDDVNYSLVRRFYNLFNRLIFSKIRKQKYYHNGITQIQKKIQKENFDKIVIFGNDEFIKPISEVITRDKIVFVLATLMLKRVDDFKLCSKILVGSSHTKRAILDSSKNFKKSFFEVIQSGIDTSYFSKIKDLNEIKKTKEELKISDSVSVICYLGRIVESKGVLEFLNAALQIRSDLSFKILLIGSFGSNFGDKKKTESLEEKKISKVICKLGDKCSHLGYVSREDLIRYLSIVDVGVVPSLCEDVSPLTYFQYQSMGIPTIVSDGGGIPEFYSPNYSVMVKRGNHMTEHLSLALQELIENKILREKMSIHALQNTYMLSTVRYYNDFIRMILED